MDFWRDSSVQDLTWPWQPWHGNPGKPLETANYSSTGTGGGIWAEEKLPTTVGPAELFGVADFPGFFLEFPGFF